MTAAALLVFLHERRDAMDAALAIRNQTDGGLVYCAGYRQAVDDVIAQLAGDA